MGIKNHPLFRSRRLLTVAVLLGCLPLMGFECDQPQSPAPMVTAHLSLSPAEPGIEQEFTLDPSRTEVIEASVSTFEYRIDAGAISDPEQQVFFAEQVTDYPNRDAVPVTTSLTGGQYTATVIAHYRDQFGRAATDEASLTFWVSACGPAPYAGDEPRESLDDDSDAWSHGTLPGAVEGTAYDADVPVQGGVDPLVFSIAVPENGPVPDWLALAPDGRLTAANVPHVNGAVFLKIRVADGCYNGARSVVLSYFLPIYDAECGPDPVFHGFDVSELKRGYFYTLEPVVDDGRPPFNLTLPADGEVPSELGMEIYGDGTLAGRPLVTGTYTFRIGVLDDCFRRDIDWVTLAVVDPLCEALFDPYEDPARATVGEFYSAVVWTGGYPPITYESVSSPIPPGLELDPATGILSGTPTEAGQSYTVFEVEDSCPEGVQSILAYANIYVDPAPGDCPPLSVTTEELPWGAQGAPYEAIIEATGGQPPLHFQELGSLPPGLTLDDDSGVITGTPTSSGYWEFDVLVYDLCEPEVQQVTRSLGIAVE